MKVLILMCMLFVTPVFSQTIELVIPFGVGGPTDIFGRSVQKFLSNELTLPVIAVNKPGAEGQIAMKYLQQKPADGNTLVVASTGTFVFNKVLINNLSYDISIFDAVIPMITMPIMVGVNFKSSIRNFNDFILQARSRNFTCGVGAASGMFAANYIKQKLDLNKLIIVPYKGVGDILIGVMGNNIDCIIDAGFVSAHQDGRIRIIAIADDDQNNAIGPVDLLKNYIPGYTQFNWWGIGWLHNNNNNLSPILRRIVQDENFRNTMKILNYQVVTPRQNTKLFLEQEYRKYELIRQSVGIEKE